MAIKAGRVGIHPSQVDPITGMLLSGPSGSTNYNDLSNKPQINGVTLSGNKTTSDLNIASDLADLDDVTISTPEAGQLLIYDGDKWENQFASISPVTPATLASLQDVRINTPELGQQLIYDGNKWENQFASISPLSLAQLRDVEITAPEDGEYLTYDSAAGKWINSGEAPVPTYTDLTATIYGAVEDTISFTDAAGISHSEVFASGQSSKIVTFKINPSGSTSITFTSAVAKNPDDLSADYSKIVTVTDATTEIKVMPDNILYWWGYEDGNLEDLSTTNGWTLPSGYSFNTPTHNKNKITCTGAASKYVAIGNKNAINNIAKIHSISQGITEASNTYGFVGQASSKDLSIFNWAGQIESSSLTHNNFTAQNGMSYMTFATVQNRATDYYACWYE